MGMLQSHLIGEENLKELSLGSNEKATVELGLKLSI